MLPVPADHHPPEDASGTIATSANAFADFNADILAGLADRPLYAVGEKTAEAARTAGFRDVRAGDGDGRALAARIAGERGQMEPGPGPLVYLAGSPRTPHLEEALHASAVPVSVLLRYEMIDISYSTDFLFRQIFSEALDCVLLYSSHSARLFSRLCSGEKAEKALESTQFVCLSTAIAQMLPEGWQARTLAAGEADEEKLLELAGLLG